MFKYTSFLKDQNIKAQTQLSALKVDFDEYVRTQFAKWQLTVAEKDVALLLLRGLNTSDIAELRSVSVGTIKVQAHNVFGKSGVSSRVEFMALFMDEFIDIGVRK
ncbi:helix-turn-helix transcriptional regulator [Rhodobacterales bacterium FZCC0083]|nr:helix-turn-helix transcriptional regulator [Rhodobacterales bacterium FZCC0083]